MPHDPYLVAKTAQARAVRLRKQKMRYRQKPSKPKYRLNLVSGSDTQKHGLLAESLACQYILNQGLEILAQNLVCRTGEIDIVALDNETIVFIEVRKRKNNRYGNAAASIDIFKQRRIIRTANYFLPYIYKHTGRKMSCRFDVISFDDNQINWLKHAFSTC